MLLTCIKVFAGESAMSFIENKGQWPKQIRCSSPLNNGQIYFENSSFNFFLYPNHQHDDLHEEEDKQAHYFQLEFIAAETKTLSYQNKGDAYYNYFIGNDPSKWASKAASYAGITYENLYPGIDMKVFGSGDNMKYEYYVSPTSNTNLIQLKYHGVEAIRLEKGDLLYETSVASVRELKPIAYQFIDGKKRFVKCYYELNETDQTIQFSFPQDYDHTNELVIDPTLIFSRLTQSTSNNFGFTATYDSLGRAYGGGIVFGNSGIYPTTTGVFDISFNGGFIDIGISCYHETTGALIYGTFVGGADDDLPNSMIVNHIGELVVLGTSGSLDFPMNALNPSYDNTFNGGSPVNYLNNGVNLSVRGSDIVVFKLNFDGSQLTGATYLGGSNNDGLNDDNSPQTLYNSTDLYFNYGDVFRGEVIVDQANNVYIASSTNSSDYPLLSSISSLGGTQDAVVSKFDPNLSNLLFSRYLGGSEDDGGYSMKIDDNGNLFVVGGTNSANFPTTTGVIHSSYQGGASDGYVAKLNGNTGAVLSSTYLGTPSYDQVFLIDLDHNNNVYVVGQSLGDYPTVNALYSLANRKQFIHKMNNNLSTTAYSMKFGSSQTLVDISPTALLVDICERVYVSGWGGSVNGNRNLNFTVNNSIIGMPLTSDALQSFTSGSGDFYFFILDKNASGLLYGSYFGGTAAEHVDGGTSRFDEQGNIYQAACASCGGGTFPTSSAGFTNNAGGLCNLGLLKMNLDLPSTSVEVDAFPTQTGCVPLTVNFSSILENVSSFQWDFGDGTSSTLPNPIHTYNDVGVYTIELIGIDSNSCNLADTAYLQVTVEDDTLIAAFIDSVQVNCDALSVNIVAVENYPTTQYEWHMGNGDIVYGINMTYTYPLPGIYDIVLIVRDSTSCELEDSTMYTVNISPAFHANIIASDTIGCLPLRVDFSNNYLLYDIISWDLGDGTTTNLNSFSHTYSYTDTFLVELIVVDSSTCNLVDTVYQNIYVYNDSIVAQIVTDPTFFFCDSMSLNAYSLNTDATSHFWNFDNGDLSSDSSAQSLYTPGVYNGFYVATNSNLLCNQSDTAFFYVNLIDAINASFTSTDTFGCEPLSIQFTNTSTLPAPSYFWDFGDGFSSTLQNPQHTFLVGNYTVMFIVSNPLTCNVADTAYQDIIIIDDSVQASINIIEQTYHCDSVVLLLNAAWLGGIHEWNMGNGDIIYGQNTSYTYTQFGDYTISYTIADSSQYCMPIDTASYSLHFAPVIANFNASDTSGCIPLNVNFNNLSNAPAYWWNTGLGSIGNNAVLPSVTYASVDTFKFLLVAIDSSSCNLQDSMIIEIITRDDFVSASFTSNLLSTCDSLEINLLNTSQNALSYFWDFEYGTSTLTNPPNAIYQDPGVYTINLIAENLNLCHPRDTTTQSFQLLPNAFANFIVLPACETNLIGLENLSNPWSTFTWTFGNNQQSNQFEPEISFPQSGNYTISLALFDSTTCNGFDTLTQEVEIYDYPIVGFTTDSNFYLYPDEVVFDNQSFIYDRFLWVFGDGTVDSLIESPTHFYLGLYDFSPCLYVWNKICPDTLCKDIYIDFEALIGVPNAFSPNGDNVNDVIYVEGVGIERLIFRIYNRWGELVFESTDQRLGWNGYYKGTLQEMEVYTYVVDAVFIDNSSTLLKGNITLLR